MKLPLVYYGDPILRKKAEKIGEIDETIKHLVRDMIETMNNHDGCGLAAPQVNVSLALFITCIPQYHDDDSVTPGQLKVFINPKLVGFSQEVWSCDEACLSIPGIEEEVERSYKVTIQATDLEGKIFTEEFTEFDAHVILHEYDHILGVLFIDRIAPKRKKLLEAKLKAIKKKHQAQS